MKISNIHQQFATCLGTQRALDHPEEFLGPNWKDVLNFWIFLDTLTKEQRKIIEERYWDLAQKVEGASYLAAYIAARQATNKDIVDSVDSVYCVTEYCSTLLATRELMGSHILKAQGKSLVFLPLFLNI